jgi:hypothetical protein
MYSKHFPRYIIHLSDWDLTCGFELAGFMDRSPAKAREGSIKPCLQPRYRYSRDGAHLSGACG